jgi:hypothetical protein
MEDEVRSCCWWLPANGEACAHAAAYSIATSSRNGPDRIPARLISFVM